MRGIAFGKIVLMSEKTKYQWEIQPQTSLLDLKLKDVWEYRDLLLLLVRRDFVSFYKQTILGPLWFFIQPLLQTIMFTFVFSRMAGISTDGLPPVLFYLAGVTAWNYFADCLVKTSTVFKDNAHIFGKVYFPRLVMPVSIVVSNLVRFGVQMLLFFVAMAIFGLKGASFLAQRIHFVISGVGVTYGGHGFGCRYDHFGTNHKI